MNPYLSLTRVRAALRGLDVRPTRGMGQNFLIDATALETIVDAADLHSSDLVIEVGPGLGVLTWELTRRTAQVLAIELDKRLAARLEQEFATAPLKIVQADVLRTLPTDLLALSDAGVGAPYKLVANLPYAITAPVLRHFLEADPSPSLSVVLVQWEVAERICAEPGQLSMLAHAVQYYADPQIVARIPADSFWPSPAVDSAVLRLHPHPASQAAPADTEALFRLMKAAFLQPRKQLANGLPQGLAALGVAIERRLVVAALEQAGVAPSRRAETVTLAEWAAIRHALEASETGTPQT
jgi:16S rRNA (adenine1518-N6/adenine1519-N6)-dimethyltransferase